MLGTIKTPTIAELIVGDLAAIRNWVVANVRSSVAWPLQVETVNFRGAHIFLVPRSTATVVANGSTITMYPFAAVKMPTGTPFKEGQRLLSHFLSYLSWVEGGGITVEHWTGGSRAHPMGENHMGGLVTSKFEADYLPDPTDEKARWALAFYREGLSLDRFNVAYAALSFFKILNIIADTGRKQKDWINAHVADFGTTYPAKFEINRRIEELKNSGITDVGEYLYESGRCAVAHAGSNPTVDPENPDDIERLTKDLPLIRALAEHVIEREFGIKSHHTVWREHLYELDAFKRHLGTAIVERLKAGDATITLQECAIPAHLRIELKDHSPYTALGNLSTELTAIENGVLKLSPLRMTTSYESISRSTFGKSVCALMSIRD